MSAPQLPPVASVEGTNTPRGSELREVFSRCVSRITGGAQLLVSQNGETIVDVAGGTVAPETRMQLFSVSKVIVALAAAHAHEAGAVDLDAPIGSYWPAFARPSTSTITARMILDHSSGICAIDHPLTTEQLVEGVLDEAVSAQEPYWEPGTAHGYHAFTFGALLNGVFRNALQTSVQEYASEHIIGPAGSDFTFGAATEAERIALAKLSFDAPILTENQAAGIMAGAAIMDGSMAPILQNASAFFGDPRVQGADWPAMSGVGSARSVASILNAALGFGQAPPTLGPKALTNLALERQIGMDRTLGHVSRFGSGVELPHGFMPYFGGGSFGHQGAGGSVAAVDPGTGTVLVYTSTHTSSTVGGSDQAVVMLATARQVLGI